MAPSVLPSGSAKGGRGKDPAAALRAVPPEKRSTFESSVVACFDVRDQAAAMDVTTVGGALLFSLALHKCRLLAPGADVLTGLLHVKAAQATEAHVPHIVGAKFSVTDSETGTPISWQEAYQRIADSPSAVALQCAPVSYPSGRDLRSISWQQLALAWLSLRAFSGYEGVANIAASLVMELCAGISAGDPVLEAVMGQALGHLHERDTSISRQDLEALWLYDCAETLHRAARTAKGSPSPRLLSTAKGLVPELLDRWPDKAAALYLSARIMAEDAASHTQAARLLVRAREAADKAGHDMISAASRWDLVYMMMRYGDGGYATPPTVGAACSLMTETTPFYKRLIKWHMYKAAKANCLMDPNDILKTMHKLEDCEEGATFEPAVFTTHAAGDAAAEMGTCDNCHLDVLYLSRCGRCRQRCYCSRECQAAHWKAGHKQQCPELAAAQGQQKSTEEAQPVSGKQQGTGKAQPPQAETRLNVRVRPAPPLPEPEDEDALLSMLERQQGIK